MDASRAPSRVGDLPYDSWWKMVLFGTGVGYAVLFITQQLQPAWGFYFLGALAGAFLLPIITRLTGGIERLILFGFVMALQFQLGFNPIWTPLAQWKQAGVVGIYISLILICAAALWLVRGLRWLGSQQVAFYVHKPLVRAATLMILAGVLSMGNTPNKRFTVFGLWELASLTLIALAAGNWSASRDGLRIMRATILFALFTQSVIILLENVAGVSFSMQEGVTGEGSWEHSRFAGTLIVPSVSATFIVIGLLFTMGRLFSAEASRQRASLVGLIGMGLLVLLISLTRSAWIAFIIGGTGLGWYLLRHGTLTLRDVRTILVILVIAAICAWPALSGRLAENHSADADARWNLVIIAMAMIKAHPILGVGLNNATTVLRDYAGIAGLNTVWIFIVHNQFLLCAAETGLVGLAAFLLLFKVGLGSAYRAMQSDEVLVRDTAAVVFWCLISLVWALNLDHVSSSMTYVFVWFLIGMATGLRMLAEGTSEKAAA